MAAIATAWLAIGSALAQDAPVKGAGPDQDQANNERYWGIANNSNNSYKTWPVTLRDPAFDRYALRHGRTTGSTQPPAMSTPKASEMPTNGAAQAPAPAPTATTPPTTTSTATTTAAQAH
jgi:hypothetical protein